MSDEGEHGRDESDRLRQLREWVELRRKVLPIETVIDQVRSRCLKESGSDRDTLEYELFALLIEARRDDEALQLLDAAIADRPNDILSPVDGWPYCHGVDATTAVTMIDFALARARRTGAWVGSILGTKAWYLVQLRRGEELGQVLEEIMAHKVRRDVPDIGRERYFVDVSPRRLIPADIRARYDTFCPKRAGDLPFAPDAFEPPDWSADGEEIPVTRPRADAVGGAEAGDQVTSAPGAGTTVPADEIDRIIFSRLPTTGNWRKTAAVIGYVFTECEDRKVAISYDEIFQRILQLVMAGALESQGHLAGWRYSEVRPARDYG